MSLIDHIYLKISVRRHLPIWHVGHSAGHISQVTIRRARLELRWVTVRGLSATQAISAGRKMKTSQSSVMRCVCRVNSGMV